MVGLQVADARFHRLAALEQPLLTFAHALWLAAVEDADAVNCSSAVAQVHEGRLDGRVREDRRLLKLLGQRIAVVGVTREGSGANDKAFLRGHREAPLHAGLIGLADTALSHFMTEVPMSPNFERHF